MDKEFHYECDNCGEDFTIIVHGTGGVPETCPFCGGDLDNHGSDDDDNYNGDDE